MGIVGMLIASRLITNCSDLLRICNNSPINMCKSLDAWRNPERAQSSPATDETFPRDELNINSCVSPILETIGNILSQLFYIKIINLTRFNVVTRIYFREWGELYIIYRITIKDYI